MSTRTVKLPLVNTDAGSRLIGYLASQQRLAYNHAVHVLNHEPSMPNRATTGSSYGLNKRTTAWRNQDPKARHAPYHIHQQGSEAAHLANQSLIESRIKRLARIEAAHARGNQPHPSDARPHRRTLARRSRKHGPQTLTIRARQFIPPSAATPSPSPASITSSASGAHSPTTSWPYNSSRFPTDVAP